MYMPINISVECQTESDSESVSCKTDVTSEYILRLDFRLYIFNFGAPYITETHRNALPCFFFDSMRLQLNFKNERFGTLVNSCLGVVPLL